MTDVGLPPRQDPVTRPDAVPTQRLVGAARDALRVAARVGTSSVFLGFVLGAASWPGTAATLAPVAGLDGSWQAALAMASHRGLRFGTQIVWTYGPLGFLTSGQLYYSQTAMLAFLFKLSLATAIFAVIVSALRRLLPLAVAFPAAFFVGFPIAAMWFGPEAVLVLMLVLCVRLLSRPDEVAASQWWWIGFGAMSGLMMLEKLSLGIGIFVLAAIALACAPVDRRRVAAGLTLGPFAAVFLVGWFGTGNGLGNLVAYARGAREAAAGYSAISLDPPNQPHDLALAAILVAVIGATAVLHARRLPAAPVEAEAEAGAPRTTRGTAFGVVGSTALVTWMLFKEAFVRQDGHRFVFFASVPLILSAFVLGNRSTDTNGDGAPAAAGKGTGTMFVAALLGTSMAALSIAGATPIGLIDPGPSITGFKGTIRTLLSSTRRDEVMFGARTTMRTIYGIPPEMLSRIGRETVDIDPVEQNVAWAYPDLHWDPLPTVQGYFAYTTALDRLNVRRIASKRAPHFILRQVQSSIDGGLPIFDEPATRVAIACNYHGVGHSPGWLLLEHGPNRCGTMQEVGRARGELGQPIAVPKASRGDMIVATFDLHLPFWWNLLDSVYKPPPIWVSLDGAALASRFVEATASELHVLKPAITQRFPGIFYPPPVHSLVLTSNGLGHSHRVTVTFYRVPVK